MGYRLSRFDLLVKQFFICTIYDKIINVSCASLTLLGVRLARNTS